MKKNRLIWLLLVVFALVLPGVAMAQDITTEQPVKKQSFFKVSNITYGGNFGFHLDSYEFSVLLMPEVGYRLFPQWKFAVAPLYSYYNSWDHYNEEHILGVRLSTTIDLVGKNVPRFNVFFYAGYQYEHHWLGSGFYNDYGANFVDVGVGLKYRITNNAKAYVLAYWHAYADHQSAFADKKWFPDAIPSITVGVEIN